MRTAASSLLSQRAGAAAAVKAPAATTTPPPYKAQPRQAVLRKSAAIANSDRENSRPQLNNDLGDTKVMPKKSHGQEDNGAAAEKEAAELKKLPFILRPFARVATRSPAILRGMTIALAVYWLQQLLIYMGWMGK